MKTKKIILYLLAMVCMLGLLSCDGDTYAGGGVGGTGRTTSSGAVYDIGSVWVNGVRFDTSEADIYIDGEFRGRGNQAVLDNLNIGRVVQVDGLVEAAGEGVADRVSYSPILVGPIDRIETLGPYETLLSILGQEAIVNDATTWYGAAMGTLAPGNLVEISGFIDDNGRMQAAFLLKLADTVTAGDQLRVTGQVSGLNLAQQHFAINTLTIRYDQADLSDLAPGGIANDLFISVNGQWQGSGTDIMADVIRYHQRLGDIDEGQVEIEGIVGQDPATRQYTLEGYLFEVTSGTTYVGGTIEDLLPGVKIELEGDLVQGSIAAETISFSQKFRAESDLSGLNGITGTLHLAGLDALTIETNDLTRFSGLVDSFDALSIGNHLVIKGWLVGDQTVLAQQVIALPEVQDKVVLRGTVLNISVPMLSINGTVVDTDTIPADGFSLGDGVPVSQALFFTTLQPADWVQARGLLLPGGQVDWSAVDLISE